MTEEPLSILPGGDFFGDYADYEKAEFGMEVPNDSGEMEISKAEVDENDDEYEGQDEYGWNNADDDDDADNDWAANNAEDETGPKLERPDANIVHPTIELDEPNDELSAAAQANQWKAKARLKNCPCVIKYGNRAGDALPLANNSRIIENQRYHQTLDDPGSPYAPFASRIEWEIACWAKFRGVSSTAFSDLMAIDGVCSFQYPSIVVLTMIS